MGFFSNLKSAKGRHTSLHSNSFSFDNRLILTEKIGPLQFSCKISLQNPISIQNYRWNYEIRQNL